MTRPEELAVCVFVSRFPVLSETFVIAEIVALAELGHPVSVYAGRRGDDPADLLPSGVDVRWVSDETRSERLQALALLVLRHPLRTLSDWRHQRGRGRDRGVPLRQLAPRVRHVAGLGRPAHVHTHFATVAVDEAIRVAALARATTSLTAHAYDIYVRSQRLGERLRRVGFSTSGCEYTASHLRELVGPGHADGIHTQIMGIDPNVFRRSAPLPGGHHVLAVGRLVEKKGFVHLVRAAAAAPAITVSIAGEGPERPALETEIARLGVGDRVTLLGAVAPRRVRALLEDADVLCMPCVVAGDGDRDSMPLVVKEAMAMEVCVVVSDEVGLPELVEPPWGALVPPGDAEALAAALESMLANDPETRRRLGRQAREHVSAVANVRDETRKLSGWMLDLHPHRATE